MPLKYIQLLKFNITGNGDILYWTQTKDKLADNVTTINLLELKLEHTKDPRVKECHQQFRICTGMGEGLIKFACRPNYKYAIIYSEEENALVYSSRFKSSGDTKKDPAIEIYRAPTFETFLIMPPDNEQKFYLRYH